MLKIKYFIGKYLLNRDINRIIKCDKFLSYNDIKSVCVIIPVDEKISPNTFKEIVKFFPKEVKVDVFGVQNVKELSSDFVASEFRILSFDDFNFFQTPKASLYSDLKKSSYDVLINYVNNDSLHSHFVAANIKAHTKISNRDIKNIFMYNITLTVKVNTEIHFIKQVIFYLKNISCKE